MAFYGIAILYGLCGVMGLFFTKCPSRKRTFCEIFGLDVSMFLLLNLISKRVANSFFRSGDILDLSSTSSPLSLPQRLAWSTCRKHSNGWEPRMWKSLTITDINSLDKEIYFKKIFQSRVPLQLQWHSVNFRTNYSHCTSRIESSSRSEQWRIASW